MSQTNNNANTAVNRTYKDRLFKMIFSSKKELLELYNAANGTRYNNPELLEINTLENAIYLSMRNDISFIIDSWLTLYEHQSTYNPNLPLRYLLYIADLYSNITKSRNLYGPKAVIIPTPRFVIFYNGYDPQPDWQELKLSESFEIPEEKPRLELIAIMLNVNKGHNQKLLNSCRTLRDYAEYVSRVRRYAENMLIEDAVETAVTECIAEGILAEFLSQNRAEAKKVSIYEYDEEKVLKDMKEAYREIAMEEGRKAGLEAGRKAGLEAGLEAGIEAGRTSFAALAEKLLQEAKTDELLKATKDKAFRDELLKNYGIE